jgi:hypothetical protein
VKQFCLHISPAPSQESMLMTGCCGTLRFGRGEYGESTSVWWFVDRGKTQPGSAIPRCLYDNLHAECESDNLADNLLGAFFVQRLETVFAQVVKKPLPLRNTKNVPIYLLCFAAGNPKERQQR